MPFIFLYGHYNLQNTDVQLHVPIETLRTFCQHKGYGNGERLRPSHKPGVAIAE